ncbi:MAG: molybdopterin molybdotransferase MoeA [Thermoplasmata archaeon]
MHAFGTLVPALTARRRLLAAVRPISRTELSPVPSSFDRVAAASIRAPRPVPAFARATWDGYALRSADTRDARPASPTTLRVVGELFAEGAYAGRLGRGEAVAIATGAALPRGADSVVIFEEVERAGDAVRILRPAPVGDRTARPGDDLPRGTPIARRGDLLGPADLGALAACGIPSLRVYARPVVEVVPNGNELLLPGAPLRPGAIYESNNATLAAVISAAGAIPRLRPPVPDDPRRLEAALRAALRRSDLVLATGGSSVGERDHLPRILPRLGTLLFHGVAVRPGKPTLAARCGRRLVIGLPGHPTSCLANMLWLVLPVLRWLARRPGPGWTEEWATLGADALAPSPGMATVVPLGFRGRRVFSTFRGSAAIASLRGTSAFALLPPGRRVARAGERIRICRLDPPLGASRPPSND